MAGTERRHAAATLVAGAAAGLVVFGVLVALLLWVASGGRPMPVSFGRTTLGVLGLVVSPIAYAAVGSVLYGLVFAFAVAYLPTTGNECCTQYSVVLTFALMALVLSFRPQGLFGRAA